MKKRVSRRGGSSRGRQITRAAFLIPYPRAQHLAPGFDASLPRSTRDTLQERGVPIAYIGDALLQRLTQYERRVAELERALGQVREQLDQAEAAGVVADVRAAERAPARSPRRRARR